MKKILFLFVALILGAMGAKADIAPGTYTIKAYGTDQYVIPSTNWFNPSDGKVTGADKATYSTTATMENGGYWVIANATEGSGFTISPADAKFVHSNGDHGYLNPWDASASKTSAAVGCWNTTAGDDRWAFTPVDGLENVYTIKALSKTFADIYLYYNANASLLYYNAPVTPAETNYFVVEAIPVEYTVTVKDAPSDVTVYFKSEPVVDGKFSTRVTPSTTDITATDVDGYMYSVSISGTTITVTYAVKNFPAAGTYFVTFKGKDSGRPQYLYNDLTQADGYTLASSTEGTTNAFIWRAVCDGTDMTIKNGQGQTIGMVGKSSAGTFTTSELTYTAHSDCYYLKTKNATGMKSSHNCLNQSNSSDYANAAGTYTVTSWSTTSGPNANDNHWYVNVVSDKDFYDVVIVDGTAASGNNYSIATYVNFNGQHAANGGFFAVDKGAAVNVEDFTCTNAPAGKEAQYTIDGKSITVTFVTRVNPDWAELESAIEAAEAVSVGEGLGQYNSANYAAAKAAADALNNNHEGKTIAEVHEAAVALNDAVAALTLNMPKTGQFFRIKTSSSWISIPTYMKGTQGSYGGRNVVEFTQDVDEIAGDNTIFCYFHTNGDYLACYGNGMTVANNSNFMGIKQYPSTTAVAFQAATTGNKVGKYNIKFSGSRFLYTNKGLYGDAGSGSTAEGYNFELEEVTALPVSVSAAGFATLYAPVALTIPADVEAYTLAFDGTYLQATAVEGTIPANTGVVLKATESSYDFAITTGGTATSELSGTVPAIAKPAGALVLGLDDEGHVGFYTPNESVANLAGFKAYYVPTSSSESNLRISFGELTSIISAAKENGGQAIFDLQGRRVLNAKNGLFIQNGKKVIR